MKEQHNPCQCSKCKAERKQKARQALWNIYSRLEKASKGCG